MKFGLAYGLIWMGIRSNSDQFKCILFTNNKYLTNSMKQSPSSEAKSCSVSQEISLILRNLKFPAMFTRAYHNSVYTPVSYFFKIQFNIALVSVPTHTHTHTHARTRAHTHTHTHTHTHSLIHSLTLDKRTHTQHDYFRSPFVKGNNA
jgi:hypothetical protein